MKLSPLKLLPFISLFVVNISFAHEIQLTAPFDIFDNNLVPCKLRDYASPIEQDADQLCEIRESNLFKGHEAENIVVGLKEGKVIYLMIGFSKNKIDLKKLYRDIESITPLNLDSKDQMIMRKSHGVYYSYQPEILTLGIIYHGK